MISRKHFQNNPSRWEGKELNQQASLTNPNPLANSPIVSPPLRNSTRPILLFAANVSRGIVERREAPEVGGRSWTWTRADDPFLSILQKNKRVPQRRKKAREERTEGSS